MALIPPDAGIRLRMQTEANLLEPLAPVHEIPSDLPDLPPGRAFTARIQDVLPENTYRALVAGKTVTLSLPEGAKTGDQLELVVVDRSTRAIIAKPAGPQAAPENGAPTPYPFTRLSSAAQLISQLLPADGEAPPPALLNRGQPLSPVAPDSRDAAAQLMKSLSTAVSQSGLFYESHQAQWVTGKLPLAQLLQEPQGQYASPLAFATAEAEAVSSTQASPQTAAPPAGAAPLFSAGEALLSLTDPSAPSTAALAGDSATGEPLLMQGSDGVPFNDVSPDAVSSDGVPSDGPSPEEPLPTTLPAAGRPPLSSAHEPASPAPGTGNFPWDAGGKTTGNTAATASGQTPAGLPQIPEDLRPLVQQQLDAAATQRVFWHGEVWPQQTMEWEIEREGQHGSPAEGEGNHAWRTSLSLTTPRLGKINAALHLSPAGVVIAMTANETASVSDLQAASPQLAEALAAAGLPLLAFQVKHTDEHIAGPG